MGLKWAYADAEVSCESVRLNRKSAVETGCLECSRGRRNSWCSVEMIRYHEELRLRRQLTGLELTLMLESVGIKQD